MQRRFGIELEIVGITERRAAAALRAVGLNVVTPGYTHAVMTSWKIVPDGSVRDGFEVVSPILEGEQGLAEAATAIDALKAAGASANRHCGMHIHLNASDLTTDDLRTAVRRYAAFESEIDAFMPPSRRGDDNRYCQSIRSLPNRPNFRNAHNVQALAQAQNGRYFKVNLQSLLRYNSLEFRQHNGIVDADRATHWIRFLDAFIAESVRRARAPQTAASVVPAAPAPVAASVPAAPNGRMTAGQRRVFDLIRQPGGATIEAVAAQCGIQVHSARAVVTHIRQSGYTVRVNRVNGEARYEIVGAIDGAAVAATAPAPAAAPADSLWAGVDEKVAKFYRNRAAVLALPS